MIDRDPWDPAPEPDPQYVDPAWLNSLHSVTSREPTAPPERLKTSDMRADINARIALSSQNDPPLLPQLLQKTLEELQRAANGGIAGEETELWARALLEQLHDRAVSGVPYGEPVEPAWSLDPDPRPFERVLSDGDGDLG